MKYARLSLLLLCLATLQCLCGKQTLGQESSGIIGDGLQSPTALTQSPNQPQQPEQQLGNQQSNEGGIIDSMLKSSSTPSSPKPMMGYESSSTTTTPKSLLRGGLLEKVKGLMENGKEMLKKKEGEGPLGKEVEKVDSMLDMDKKGESPLTKAPEKVKGKVQSEKKPEGMLGKFGEKAKEMFGKKEESGGKGMANMSGKKQENGQSKSGLGLLLNGLGSENISDDSVVADVLNKTRESIKEPVEKVMKPLDKLLGVEQDPLVKAIDKSYELLREPISTFAKPVDTMVKDAFETVDESKKRDEAKWKTMNQEERKKLIGDVAAEQDRSIFGNVADKAFDLSLKPLEIVLKPIEKQMGVDKDPILKTAHSVYKYAKQPSDKVAKPFEKILMEMGGQDHLIKIDDSTNPLLVTRLADGALNIADKVITIPLEYVLSKLIGNSKNNSLLEAAHSFKNASRKSVELLTRPIDKILTEIADIGDKTKTQSEREMERQRQNEEASRLIKALDKIHENAQKPIEFALKPIDRLTGGGKQPILRTWDVFHELYKRPIQVITKPIEDALFGHNPNNAKDWQHYKPGPGKHDGFSAASWGPAYKEERQNIIVDQIKKLEKMAAKPIIVLTAPIRNLIQGSKKNKTTGAKANDNILSTLEKFENVVLRPLELLTLPLSDLFAQFSQKSQHQTQQPGGLEQDMQQQHQGTQQEQHHQAQQNHHHDQQQHSQQQHDLGLASPPIPQQQRMLQIKRGQIGHMNEQQPQGPMQSSGGGSHVS